MRIVYNAPEYLDSAGVEHLVHELRIYIQQILDGQLDVTSYATKAELQSEINTINTTLSSYVTDTELQTALNNLDLSDYVTVTALNTALANYYTKSEIDSLIPTVHDVNTALANKVDKIAGKGLSTNDYTTAEKNKLSGIDYATDSEIQSVWDTGGGNNE